MNPPSVPKRVVIDGQWTYETTEEVHLGDRVVLPSGRKSSLKGQAVWEGTVTSLQSAYTGPCKQIIRVVRDEPPPQPKEA